MSSSKLNDVYLRLFLLSGTRQHGRPLLMSLEHIYGICCIIHDSKWNFQSAACVKTFPPSESSCQLNLQLFACCQCNVELSNHVMQMAGVKPQLQK